MKKIILSIAFVVAAILNTSAQSNKNIKIETTLSSVEWIGKKVTGQHKGTIAIQSGTLSLIDSKLGKGTITINMGSITCADLTGEWNDKLIGHLKSPDFFDVENNKTAVLEITKVTEGKDGNSMVLGNLTIKGITKPIEFASKIEIKEGKLAAFAEVTIDRTLYDIKYGSGKFFEGLGDKTISDEFIVKFKIAAK